MLNYRVSEREREGVGEEVKGGKKKESEREERRRGGGICSF